MACMIESVSLSQFLYDQITLFLPVIHSQKRADILYICKHSYDKIIYIYNELAVYTIDFAYILCQKQFYLFVQAWDQHYV